MRKAIGILVIVLCLLSIGAFILGNMLFGKRELLKGRTQYLESSITKIGKLIEEAVPEAPGEMKPEEFVAKDVSPCKAEIPEKLDYSTFWDKYRRELEVTDLPTINMDTNRMSLMNLYKRDAFSGEVVLDQATGFPVKEGEGTMHSVLDGLLIQKAEVQYLRLNETRGQLKQLRVELVDTIREFNRIKNDFRASLKEIETLKGEIATLKEEITKLTEQVEQVEAEKKTLQDENNDLKGQIAKLNETLQDKEQEITMLEKKIASTPTDVGPGGGGAAGGGAPVKLAPGQKGKVLSVNPEWNFVVLELTDEVFQEVTAAGRGELPGVELLVKRLGKPDQFVTKVLITQVRPDKKLAIANNISSWQQLPVKEGDVLFY